MNHWPECINIWHVTSFGHSLIKEHIWQKPGERYRPIGPLVVFNMILGERIKAHWISCYSNMIDILLGIVKEGIALRVKF